MKKVRRAAAVASVSGWSLIAFAALTLLGVLFGDMTALVLAIPLGALGANELRGAAMFRGLDLRAPRTLGWNQIALGVLVIVYAAWSLSKAMHDPALASLGGTTGDPQMDRMVESLTTTVAVAFYGALAFAAIVGPGLTSLYYFTRAGRMRRMLEETPEWVTATLRAAA